MRKRGKWEPPFGFDPEASLNWGLTPNQMKIFQCNDRNIMAVTGRRFGKTQVGAIKLLTKAVTLPNQNLLYLALTQKHAQTLLEKRLELLCHPYFLESVDRGLPISFNFFNGSKITLGGTNNPDRLQGQGFDLIVVDEIGDHSQRVFEQILLPTLADKEGDLLLIGTPKGPENWTTPLLTDPNFTQFRYTTLDGGVVSQKEIERIQNIMDPKIYRQEFLGEIVSMSGLVYPQFEKAVQNVDNFDRTGEVYATLDWNVNPMTCVLLQRNPNKLGGFIAKKEFVIPDSNTYDMVEHIKIFLQEIDHRGELIITGDYAGGHRSTANHNTSSDWDIITELFKNYRGFRTEYRRTTSIRTRVNHVNQALRDGRLIISDKCEILWKELASLEWNTGFKTGINSKNGTAGHITDALSYFCYNFLDLVPEMPTMKW